MLGATIYLCATGVFMVACALVEFWGGNATGPDAADLPCSGNGHSEAALPGGEPRDDPFSHGPYGDWPFVPADLKISRFHVRKDAA